MATYKLTYFNARRRGEVARMLFALADQPYTDEIIEQDDWVNLKPETPFGTLPLLQVDDDVISQGHAIDKYLAKQFGYAGTTALEEAQIDMVTGHIDDLARVVFERLGNRGAIQKADVIEKFAEKEIPQLQVNCENMLAKNGTGYLVGKEITLADVHLAVAVRTLEEFGVDLDMDQTPKLRALVIRVEANYRIAKWIATRPELPL